MNEEIIPYSDLPCEIVAEMEACADLEAAHKGSWAHKTEGYVSYGMNAGKIYNIFRHFRPSFKSLSLDQSLALAEQLILAGVEELSLFANGILALKTQQLGPAHFSFLDRYLDNFHSWSVTDDFCLHVLQPVLRAHRTETLALLERWNPSSNLWKRRASVVVFTRRIGASGGYTEACLALCENLVFDSEDLVRKGVGWALKDTMRGDPERVLKYVRELRRRGVSSVITLYAIRDLKGAAREAVLAVKKAR